MMPTLVYVILSFYFLAVVGIWLWSGRRVRGGADFYVAGRSIPWYALSASLFGTAVSAVMFTGGAAIVVGLGAGFLWLSAGVCAGFALQLFLGIRLRRFGKFTVSDFLTERFDGPAIPALTTIILVVLMTGYVGVNMIAAGIVAELLFGIPYVAVVIGLGVLFTAYVLHGGMVSVIWTDMLQAVVMIVSIIFATPYLISAAGGFDTIVTSVQELSPGYYGFTGLVPVGAALGIFLSWTFGTLVNPALLTRFYSAISVREGVKGGIAAMVTQFVVNILIFGFTLTAAFVLIPDPADPELLLIQAISEYAPAFLLALAIGGVLAGAMSTTDSQLLAASSMLSRDVFWRLFGKGADEKGQLRIARLCTLPVGLIGMWIAVARPGLIIEMIQQLLGIAGAAIGPALIASIFWRNVTEAGAISSMLLGGLIAVVSTSEAVAAAIAPVPGVALGLIVSTISLIVVSRFTKPSRKAVEFYDSIVARDDNSVNVNAITS